MAYRTIKRAADLVGSAAAIVVSAPVMAAAAVAVRLSSPGPVIFRQVRVGLHGREFEVYKFRTMWQDASSEAHRTYVLSLLQTEPIEQAPPAVSEPASAGESATPGVATAADTSGRTPFKIGVDTRITPVGKVLRRWSIDELPQLFNVLKGDMSLIGPRPDLPYIVTSYDDRQQLRLTVLPGLTGLWQVSGRGMLSPRDMLELDAVYAEQQSWRMDLSILFKTVPAVLAKTGAE